MIKDSHVGTVFLVDEKQSIICEIYEQKMYNSLKPDKYKLLKWQTLILANISDNIAFDEDENLLVYLGINNYEFDNLFWVNANLNDEMKIEIDETFNYNTKYLIRELCKLDESWISKTVLLMFLNFKPKIGNSLYIKFI